MQSKTCLKWVIAVPASQGLVNYCFRWAAALKVKRQYLQILPFDFARQYCCLSVFWGQNVFCCWCCCWCCCWWFGVSSRLSLLEVLPSLAYICTKLTLNQKWHENWLDRNQKTWKDIFYSLLLFFYIIYVIAARSLELYASLVEPRNLVQSLLTLL